MGHIQVESSSLASGERFLEEAQMWNLNSKQRMLAREKQGGRKQE